MAHRHDFIVVTVGSFLTRPITSPKEYYSEPSRRTTTLTMAGESEEETMAEMEWV